MRVPFGTYGSFAAILMLAACGGGGGSSAVQPQFAGAEPPDGLEDILGRTFPLHIVALNFSGGDVGEVTRSTWSLRYTSETTAVLTTDFGTINLTEVGGQLVGSIGNIEVEATVPSGGEYLALSLVDYGNALTQSGATGAAFFGLETPQSGIDALVDADSVLDFEGDSLMFVEFGSDVSDIEQLEGETILEADFANGTVTGSLLETANSTISLTGGTLVGNGFAGTMSVGGDLAIAMSIAESDVQGIFYGGAAEEIAGTFIGSGT